MREGRRGRGPDSEERQEVMPDNPSACDVLFELFVMEKYPQGVPSSPKNSMPVEKRLELMKAEAAAYASWRRENPIAHRLDVFAEKERIEAGFLP